MRELMDNGKNLCLSTANGVNNMHTLDSAFMADYFKASYMSDLKWPLNLGVTGSITENLRFMWDTEYFSPNSPTNLMNIEGSGQSILYAKTSSGVTGIAYSGAYKSVLLSVPIEFINDNFDYEHSPKSVLTGKIIDFFGGIVTSVSGGSFLSELPSSFDLKQNYPNPFNPTTIISYTVRATETLGQKVPTTNLTIFNVLGRKVKTLVDEVQIPGTYYIEWDGTDSRKNKVASGIYFYRLSRGQDYETKKMALIKEIPISQSFKNSLTGFHGSVRLFNNNDL
jgi:hypothetical protein